MGKLDELRRGAGATPPRAWASRDRRDAAGRPRPRSAAEPTRYQGLERLKGANEIPVDRIIAATRASRGRIFDEAALQELVEMHREPGRPPADPGPLGRGAGMYVDHRRRAPVAGREDGRAQGDRRASSRRAR